MKKSPKKTKQRRAAPTKPRTVNPAEQSLTEAHYAVYCILSARQHEGKTTTSGDVAAEWGGKNRSYTYKVLKALIDKGLVEQYSQCYYKLTNRGK